MMGDACVAMSSLSAVKRPAPTPAPRRQTSDTMPEGAAVPAVVTGNGNAGGGGGHDVTSSAASSSTDESIQLVAELPDERRVTLYVDARYLHTLSIIVTVLEAIKIRQPFCLIRL